MTELTAERLREVLNYDPETGVFTRRISSSRWRIGTIAGGSGGDDYLKIRVDGRRYRAHRLAFLYMLGRWPFTDADHIDCDKANNVWSNLREASTSQNLANMRRPSNNTSGFKGVSFRKDTGKWLASIRVDGIRYHLGYYRTAEKAHSRYMIVARIAFAEFARAA